MAEILLNTPKMDTLGFESMSVAEIKPRVSIASRAREKEGKSYWSFTAPGPLGVISLDTGTEDVLQTFVNGKGKKASLKKLKSAKDMLIDKDSKDAYVKEWQRAKDCIAAIIDNRKISTLVIDTATELWELCRLSYHGKLAQVMPHQYAEPNDAFRSLLKSAYEDRKDLNAVWIHKMKKEYRTSAATGKDAWNGKYEFAGMSDVPFLVGTNIRNYRTQATDGEGNTVTGVSFGIEIIDSRQSPELVTGLHLTGKDCSFDQLAMFLWPDADPDIWMDRK